MTSPAPRRDGSAVVARLVLAAALVAAALVYGIHLSNGFTLDDHAQITGNPSLRPGVSWWEPFTRDLWSHLRGQGGEMQSYYRPLLYLLYRVAGAGGLEPWRFHLASLLLHLAAGGAAFGTLRLLGAGRLVAAIATAVFLLHPLAAEAVFSAADACDQLLLLFLLGALSASVAARGAGGWRRVTLLSLATLATFGALLSKETAIVVAPLLTFEALRPPRRGARELLARIAGPWGATVAWFLLRQAVVGSIDLGGPAASLVRGLGRSGLALGWYLLHLLLPWPLTPFHPFPAAPELGGLDLVGFALLALMFVLAAVFLRDAGRFFWSAFLVLPLLPPLALFFSGRVVVTGVMVAERYLYVSLVPFAAGIALLVSRGTGAARKAMGATLALLLVAGLAAVSAYGGAFRDDEAMFRHAARFNGASPFVLDGLGSAALARGDLAAALKLFGRAVELEPRSAIFRLNLGVARLKGGDRRGGIDALRAGLALDDGVASAHSLLGDALRDEGLLDEAGGHYRRAVELAPEDAGARTNLGAFLWVRGEKAAARSEWERAFELDPVSADAAFDLGMACRELADSPCVQRALERFLRLAPAESPQREPAESWLAEALR